MDFVSFAVPTFTTSVSLPGRNRNVNELLLTNMIPNRKLVTKVKSLYMCLQAKVIEMVHSEDTECLIGRGCFWFSYRPGVREAEEGWPSAGAMAGWVLLQPCQATVWAV